MRAVFVENGEVVLRETEVADKGIRVHVRSSGICGSDIHLLERKYPLKYVIGHEFAGELDDGTTVAVEPLVPCNECAHCRAGNYHLCQLGAAMVLGVGRNGGMADEVFVPRRCLTFLPSTVDVKDGCLVEPLAIAVHGMRISGFKGNQRVAVIGGGTIGICAVAVAKASSDTVGLAARYSHQKAAGSLLGATDVDGQYDLIVECTGNSEAVNQAVRLCSPGATILALGTNWEGIQIPEVAAQSKEVTMVFSTMYSAKGAMRDFDVAAMLLARNPTIPKALITHRYPMVEVSKAFAAARDRRAGAIKVVLEP